jgi:hypothetical protein
MILGTIRCIAWRQDLLHGPGAELSREEVDFALRGGGVRGGEQTGERAALDRSLWGEKHKQRRRGWTRSERKGEEYMDSIEIFEIQLNSLPNNHQICKRDAIIITIILYLRMNRPKFIHV